MLSLMYTKKKRPLPVPHQPHGSETTTVEPLSSSDRRSRYASQLMQYSSQTPTSRQSFRDAMSNLVTGRKPRSPDRRHGPAELSEEDDEDLSSPEPIRPRRRFVKSGMTTYEQCISKNAMGRRFNKRGNNTSLPSNVVTSPPRNLDSDGGWSDMDERPSVESTPPNSSSNGRRGVSSLSSALKEVINSRPTALKSVVDPTTLPPKEIRAFVVEQTPEGHAFVMSKRLQPVRQTMDDSFIGAGRQHAVHTVEAGATTTSDEFGGEDHAAAANLVRHSDASFTYSQGWGKVEPKTPSSATANGRNSTRRRRLSISTRFPSVSVMMAPASGTITSPRAAATTSHHPHHHHHHHHHTHSGSRRLSVASVKSKMATTYVDITRPRRGSRSSRSSRRGSVSSETGATPSKPSGRAPPPPPPQPLGLRSNNDEGELVVPRHVVEYVDIDDDAERHKGPMTMDELLFDGEPVQHSDETKLLPSTSSVVKQNNVARGPEQHEEDSEDEEDDSLLTNSFRNLKDVDLLTRKRSMEDLSLSLSSSATSGIGAEPVVPPVSMTLQDLDRQSEDYGDVDDRFLDGYSSTEDDTRDTISATRSSNISEFLGGFKSRSSMNRSSLMANRNSLLGMPSRRDDYASRAARSLGRHRKAAATKAESELARKLREARNRIPVEFRDDLAQPIKKKRGTGLRSALQQHLQKRVRFDMTRYCREFVVEEPEETDEDDVDRWRTRDSELDDDDEDDDDDYHEEEEEVVDVRVSSGHRRFQAIL